MSGWSDFEDTINATTLGLVIVALMLGLTLASPQAMRDFAERLSTLKFGGVEIGLQALSRAERTQAQLPQSQDDVEVEERPRTGDPIKDYREVRGKLEQRLRFARDAILELSSHLDYSEIVGRIEAEGLLKQEERKLLDDLLGGVEDEVAKWPDSLRAEFYDVSWRFASRFGTLIFERLVRKRIEEAGWFVADFDQDRDHRPDFLAYRDPVWLILAARVMPSKIGSTRRRLASERPPFQPLPVIVIPDTRNFDDDGKHPDVEVLQLQQLLRRTANTWKKRAEQ